MLEGHAKIDVATGDLLVAQTPTAMATERKMICVMCCECEEMFGPYTRQECADVLAYNKGGAWYCESCRQQPPILHSDCYACVTMKSGCTEHD